MCELAGVELEFLVPSRTLLDDWSANWALYVLYEYQFVHVSQVHLLLLPRFVIARTTSGSNCIHHDSQFGTNQICDVFIPAILCYYCLGSETLCAYQIQCTANTSPLVQIL